MYGKLAVICMCGSCAVGAGGRDERQPTVTTGVPRPPGERGLAEMYSDRYACHTNHRHSHRQSSGKKAVSSDCQSFCMGGTCHWVCLVWRAASHLYGRSSSFLCAGVLKHWMGPGRTDGKFGYVWEHLVCAQVFMRFTAPVCAGFRRAAPLFHRGIISSSEGIVLTIRPGRSSRLGGFLIYL